VKRTLWLALSLWLLACDDESGPSAALANRCFAEEPCLRLREGRGPKPGCDDQIGACVLAKTEEPYELFVRVRATTEGSMLADAGITLVPETVSALGTLNEGRDAQVLRVPRAVTVRGSVRAETDAGIALLESQLTISPRDAMVPVTANVFETRHSSIVSDGGLVQLQALLDPELGYDVNVQPLLADSRTLPPKFFADMAISRPLNLAYGAVEARRGKFIFRDSAVRPLQVRLQDKLTGAVVSSNTRVETTFTADGRYEGTFELYAEPQVFERGSFNLVVGLADLEPWQVTITIDGAGFLAGGDMFLPRIPRTVSRESTVERTTNNALIPNADLEFVSRYPLPPDAGTSAPSAGGTDWCHSEDLARITCSGHFHTTSDQDGEYRIDLLPGEYEVIVLPRAGEPAADGLIATKKERTYVVLETDSPLAGVVLNANGGTPYTGTVSAGALTAGGLPAPKVTLRALRRPTPPFSSWGLAANFNRTISAVSDSKGHVELLPDVGYYDFVLEPGDGSDFPWKLWLDCPNGPGAGGPLRPLALSAPVMVSGTVEHDGVPLPGAQIEAFTIVEHAKNGSRRSVLIGRAQSDERGAYRLALPSRVGESDGPNPKCESAARELTDSERVIR
jgi:hypothetical protein